MAQGLRAMFAAAARRAAAGLPDGPTGPGEAALEAFGEARRPAPPLGLRALLIDRGGGTSPWGDGGQPQVPFDTQAANPDGGRPVQPQQQGSRPVGGPGGRTLERAAAPDELSAAALSQVHAQTSPAPVATGREASWTEPKDGTASGPPCSSSSPACPPGLAGCYGAGEFDPSRDRRRTVQADADLDASAAQNLAKLKSPDLEERFGSFSRGEGGGVAFEPRPGKTTYKQGVPEGQFTLPKGSSAGAHSHPEDAEDGIVPGTKDHLMVEAGRPSYIYHGGRILVLEVVDGQYRARLIQGAMTTSERKALRSRLNDFQRGTRPKSP
jgi:hypothetical protein